MKGNNPSAMQKRWHDTLASLCGCICCTLDGRLPDYSKPANVSVHHCDGRTKPLAHWYVIPLCAGHHQDGYGEDPNMLAVHGHKARFIAEYGREIELLEMCVQLTQAAGKETPGGVQELLAQWHASPLYQGMQAEESEAA